MKTKTTITVETYKFSAVRFNRERPSNICVRCRRDIAANDHVAVCDQTNEIASEIGTRRIKSNNGELK